MGLTSDHQPNALTESVMDPVFKTMVLIKEDSNQNLGIHYLETQANRLWLQENISNTVKCRMSCPFHTVVCWLALL